MLVIFQVHAELSARVSVIEIWIESARRPLHVRWPSTFQGQDPALKALHGLQKYLKIDVLEPRSYGQAKMKP